MRIVALAGGIGAGKFLRGLIRLTSPRNLTVVLNVGDDIEIHGLHVSPDPDSVTYWLGGEFDPERGWGRRGDTFRTTQELRSFGSSDAWFNLGDLDLATHLYRTALLRNGATLSEATARIAARFGVQALLLPATNDPVTTRIDAVDSQTGRELDLHFQEYWVLRRGVDQVKAVRYEGAQTARPAPGVLEAVASADVIVICPSNPVVSIGPILALPDLRKAVARRRSIVTGVSGIIAGAPVSGMADRLMPAAGIEVSAAGVADAFRDLLAGWVIDERDRDQEARISGSGLRVAVTNTLMVDDQAAEKVARAAVELVTG